VPVYLTGGLKDITEVSAGGFFSLARLSDSTIVSWGADEYGELGNGTKSTTPHYSLNHCGPHGQVACSIRPVAVCAVHQVACSTTSKELSGVKAVSAGGYHGLALLKNGTTVVSWGYNEYGQLGVGLKYPPGPETGGYCANCSRIILPVTALPLSGLVTEISAGGQFTSLALQGGP
jgi:alpha-tubulin suppressor-like RCC1 family protein